MSHNRSGESGYQKKLRDPRWQKRRLAVLTDANWQCEDAGCRRSDNTLEVHHIYYEWGKDPWDYPPEAFLALCETCHDKRSEVERAIKIELLKSLRRVPIRRIEKVAWNLIDNALREQEAS